MLRVLSREVFCEGKTYLEGTSLERLPECHRSSLIGTGWTRLVAESAEEEAAQDEPEPEPEPEPAAEPEPEPSPKPTVKPKPEPPADDPSIDSLGLGEDVVELLAEAGITTISQAKDYRNINKSFRVIKGIGKVTDGEINAAIDQ